MGTKLSTEKTMLDALFPQSRQRVLGLLFGQPDRSFFAREIIALAKTGNGAVQRELERLLQSGLIICTSIGRQQHYQANPNCPLLHELTSLFRKTSGLKDPLYKALLPVKKHIYLALIYGSVAKKTDTARSDIDVLIVSDRLGYDELYKRLDVTAQQLGRRINPTLYTKTEYEGRLASGKDNFLKRIHAADHIRLIGNDHAN
jgi:predicted nucleotidyltransferase